MKAYTNLRVLSTTHQHLKALAAHEGQAMTDLLEALVAEAYTAMMSEAEGTDDGLHLRTQRP
jgi:hypothetical protein